MKCDQCQTEMAPDEAHEHAGRMICDDCYMDAMSPKTGCDPWAVYTATRLKDQDMELTPVQEAIVKLVAEKKQAEIPDLIAATGLDLEGLKREVVTLRHLELVGWNRRGQDDIVLQAFE